MPHMRVFQFRKTMIMQSTPNFEIPFGLDLGNIHASLASWEILGQIREVKMNSAIFLHLPKFGITVNGHFGRLQRCHQKRILWKVNSRELQRNNCAGVRSEGNSQSTEDLIARSCNKEKIRIDTSSPSRLASASTLHYSQCLCSGICKCCGDTNR